MKYTDKTVNNILLIDINVPDYQEVVDSVNSNTLAIVYDYNDTYEDLSNILQKYDISKGRIGIFFELNKPFLNGTFFENQQSMIELINYHKILHIDYLACNTLNYPEWVNYYKELPCIVGASNNETGNIDYGGDWIMESTRENIKSIYFSNIESYKHLLGPNYVQHRMGGQINLPVGNPNTAAVAVMNNTSSNTIMVMWQQVNNTGNKSLFVMNYSSSIPNTTIFGHNNTIGGYSVANTMVIYKSPFNCPTNTNADPSKDYLCYSRLDSQSIDMLYNIGSPPATGTISVPFTQTNLINLGAGILNVNCGITNYQNFLYYSTTLFTIGRATIIEPTANGVIPTCTVFNNNYISTTDLSSSYTYYPTQLTTDTSGKLYIVMANVTTVSSTTSNIIIMDPNTKIKTTINFYDVFSPFIYGYYRSIAWYNNILYIGTSVGTNWTASSSGYIIAYNTQSNFLQIYRENPGSCPSALAIYDGITPALLSTNLLIRTANFTEINVFTPIKTLSGFYQKNFNNAGYNLDIASI